MKPKHPILRPLSSPKSPVGQKAPRGIVQKTIPRITKKK